MNLNEADSSENRRRMIRDLVIIGGLLCAVAIVYSAMYLTTWRPQANSAGQASGSSVQQSGRMDDAAQLVNTGNQHMDSGRHEAAILHYSRALLLDSTLVDVRVDRGASFFALGRYHEAISDFSSAFAAEPDHVTAHFNLGIAYGALGYDSLAISYWERCLMLQPNGDLADKAKQLLEQHGQ